LVGEEVYFNAKENDPDSENSKCTSGGYGSLLKSKLGRMILALTIENDLCEVKFTVTGEMMYLSHTFEFSAYDE
jgi:hypothetical protein